MKRVLLIAFDFPPAGGTSVIRAAKFARYLPEYGWEPVVVCSDVTWHRDDAMAAELPADLPVRRVGWPRFVRALRPDLPTAAPTAAASGVGKPPRGGGALAAGLKRMARTTARRLLVPDQQVLWAPGARRAVAEMLAECPCDAMITTSPPYSLHLVGAWAHRRFGLPWVADYRDVWTVDNPWLAGLGRLAVTRQRRAEVSVLAAADRVTVIGDRMGQRLAETFGVGLAGKLVTITNGFDPAEFEGPPPPRDPQFTLLYMGSVVSTRAGNAFPEGLRLALEHSEPLRHELRFRFVGQADPAYQARFAGLEANVEFKPYVTHAAAMDMLRRAHALLLLLPNTEESRLAWTNKFFEYLAARRPVLAVAPTGVVTEAVTAEHAGETAMPDDAAGIARALLTLFDTLHARPNAYQPSDALLARFDRRQLAGRLAAVLDDITRDRRTRGTLTRG
jgi:glycosyltransferase involved in cell wall biosynthesis